MEFNRHRPVPSKGALRVLYQLAYISSGTLVGVAALCAEERRRRTQILQKIADNARQIRQSPRYNHHAAASISGASDEDISGLWFGHRSRAQPCRDSPSSSSAPFLPSAVAEGYDHVVRKRKKREMAKRWKDTIISDTMESARSADTTEERNTKDNTGPASIKHSSSKRSSRHPFNNSMRIAQAISIEAVKSKVDSHHEPILGQQMEKRNQTELLMLWQRTRNVSRVLEEADALEGHARPGDKEAVQKLRVARLEFLIAADQIDAAIKLAAELHSIPSCGQDVLILSALLCAKDAKWNEVFDLMDAAKRESPIDFDPPTIARINKMIQLHTSKEGPDQTWRFIDELGRRYAFVPDDQTSLIMLGAFVDNGRYEMLPRWVKHVGRLGSSFSLHGMHVASLVTRYYHQHRPTAAFLESMCRTLNRSHSSLAGDQYKRVIKHAISSEALGTGSGQKRATFDAVQRQLARIEKEFLYVHSRGDDRDSAVVLGPLHADLLFCYSQEKYRDVIELYEASLGARNIPVSITALESAVQASIKLHDGDTSHASWILDHAWGHGVSRACGEHILVMHRMRTLPKHTANLVHIITDEVQSYDSLVSKTGQTPSPKVWIQAAQVLIKRGHAREGLGLLQQCFSTQSSNLKQLSSSSMTAFLRGFAALRSLQGVQWVVVTMQEQNRYMSLSFLRALSKVVADWDEQAPLRSTVSLEETTAGQSATRNLLQTWLASCQARREEQSENAIALGYELVDCIIKCVEDPEAPDDPVTAHCGFDRNVDQSLDEPNESTFTSAGGYFGLPKPAESDAKWQVQYRRFHDRRHAGPEGDRLSFRYFDPETDIKLRPELSPCLPSGTKWSSTDGMDKERPRVNVSIRTNG